MAEQYYLRARYYNPVIGQFIQEDTFRGDGLNLYAYCGNNPVVYYDPSGYSQDSCGGVGFEGSEKRSKYVPENDKWVSADTDMWTWANENNYKLEFRINSGSDIGKYMVYNKRNKEYIGEIHIGQKTKSGLVGLSS